MKQKKIIVALLMTFTLAFVNLSGVVSVPAKIVSAKTKIDLKITNVTGLSGKHQVFKIKVKNNGKKTVTVKMQSACGLKVYNPISGKLSYSTICSFNNIKTKIKSGKTKVISLQTRHDEKIEITGDSYMMIQL